MVGSQKTYSEQIGILTEDTFSRNSYIPFPRVLRLMPQMAISRPTITTPKIQESPSQFYLISKRIVDIAGSLAGLVLLSPLFLVLFILVRLSSPGPVFHRRRVLARQKFDGTSLDKFDAFKFRTMVTNADEVLQNHPQLMAEYLKEFKLTNDPRITRIGGPLRRLSLDELPQLWNVLTGQMSLVGPRMITEPELTNYGGSATRLLSVKPGITGLWQVSGRTNVSYTERVRLDLYYIENRSLKMDIEILLRTVICVLARKGAV